MCGQREGQRSPGKVWNGGMSLWLVEQLQMIITQVYQKTVFTKISKFGVCILSLTQQRSSVLLTLSSRGSARDLWGANWFDLIKSNLPLCTLNNMNDCFMLLSLQTRGPINCPACLLQPPGYLRLNAAPAQDGGERSGEDPTCDKCPGAATAVSLLEMGSDTRTRTNTHLWVWFTLSPHNQ